MEMTTVRMNWARLELDAEGHAGYAPAGRDIVCAGISAVTMALLNYLMEEERKGFLKVKWSMNEKSGAIRIRAKPYAAHWTGTLACYRMAVIGLRAIAENYPGNIEIEEVYESGNVGQHQAKDAGSAAYGSRGGHAAWNRAGHGGAGRKRGAVSAGKEPAAGRAD
jgi:uncharacterized protein YsxB (DUF464 family)